MSTQSANTTFLPTRGSWSRMVGGATVARANIWNAILGTVLFHTLFIVSPIAGQTLLGSAQIGEYFREFIAYAVIGVTLALHAWKKGRF